MNVLRAASLVTLGLLPACTRAPADAVDEPADAVDVASDTDTVAGDIDEEPRACATVQPSAPTPIDTVRFTRVDSGLEHHLILPTNSTVSDSGYGSGGVIFDHNRDGYPDILIADRRIVNHPDPQQNLIIYTNAGVENPGQFLADGTVPGFAGRVLGTSGRLITWDSTRVYDIQFVAGVSVVRRIVDTSTFEDFHQAVIYSVIPSPHGDALWLFFGEMLEGSHYSTSEAYTVPLEQPHNSYTASLLPYGQHSPTLSTGRADIDGDGVLDTAVVVDTLSNPDQAYTTRSPGGFIRGAISPGSTLSSKVQPWTEGLGAWGSHMGVAQFASHNQVYTALSNWGPPTLVTQSNELIAAPLEANSDAQRTESPFSWSPIVVDFNLDQRDDILLTRGSVFALDDETTTDERDDDGAEADVLFLQTGDGDFVDSTEGSGLLAHPRAYPDTMANMRLNSSRAGVATDFDRDGRVDIVILPFEGMPIHYEAETPTHCLARVLPAYSAPLNELFGWAWLDSDFGEHPLRMDGHMFFGESEYLLLPAMDGAVRAPSGAQVPYSCRPGDLIDIDEPTWAAVDGSGATLDFCKAGLEPELVQIQAVGGTIDSVPINSSQRVKLDLSSGPVSVLIDGRFAVRCAANGGCER